MGKYKTVRISDELHEWLRRKGEKDESFEKILRRLLGLEQGKAKPK